jgi:hypothetical protein
MKAATFLEKLYDLGITPSYSRPRALSASVVVT